MSKGNRQYTALEKAAKTFLERKQSGHIGFAQYGSPNYPEDKVQGPKLWKAVRQNPKYYPATEEDDLAKKIASVIKYFCSNIDTMLEFGPGDSTALEEKTIPIATNLGIKYYISIDAIESCAQDGAQFIADQSDNTIKTDYIVSNFLEKSCYHKTDNTILFMSGITLGNLSMGINDDNPLPHLSKELKRLRHYLGKNSYLLVSYDANQDRASLDDAYRNEDHAKLIENTLWCIKRDTPYQINPEHFKYNGIWMPEQYRYAHFVECQAPTTVTVGRKNIQYKTNDLLLVENSIKTPVEIFTEEAKKVKLATEVIWTDTGRSTYQLLRPL